MSAFRENHRREYGDSFDRILWIDAADAQHAAEERSELLSAIGSTSPITCGGSKIHSGPLSLGCIRCTQGQWSCLFINGRCNAGCFFCPSEQNETGTPTTNTLTFPSARDYVSYLERFGFSGSSLSGGEPFLTFDRTLTFIGKIKRRFGSRIHLWLYTNGLLHTDAKLAQLRDAGLDEMRFNIAASDYRLDKLQKSIGIIPTITVEIPAVPQDEARMRELMPVLLDLGVAHLNLHQLRLTPFNFPHLVDRGYRFADGPKITVPDSELTALRLIRFARQERIELPVNYCSFVYKHRYQARANRMRWGRLVLKEGEQLTGAGYIRSLSPNDDAKSLRVRYFSALARSRPSFYVPFQEFELGSRMSLFIERAPASDAFVLKEEAAQSLTRAGEGLGTKGVVLPEEIRHYEAMSQGLLPYR